MKSRKRKLAITIGILLLILLAFQLLSLSPTIAIRKYLFFSNPLQSLTCRLQKETFVDREYGQQYSVSGFTDGATGGGVYFAYTKRDQFGLYYWAAGGSGP